MGEMSALEAKYQKIVEELNGQATFYADDVMKVFPNMKKSSLYWNMSKLIEAGYLKRVRNGVYAFNEWHGKKSVVISDAARTISDIIDELGFDYYISGLDILQKYMQHVPDQYPCILYVNRSAKEEVMNVLLERNIEVFAPTQTKSMYENFILTGKKNLNVILYQTENFEECENGIASIERAFVDLYYAVTRNEYPLSIQELARIYENVARLGVLDKKKTIMIAGKRSLQYDIRYIVESKYITEEAHKFVEILKREE